MSLYGDVAAELPALQEAAESLMVDTCTIAHPTGMSDPDPVTGVVSETYGEPYYSGKAKFQMRDVDPRNPEAGDRSFTVLVARVDLPMSVTGVETGDQITWTASTHDPDLVGRNFRVVAPFHKTFATARRIPVEETA